MREVANMKITLIHEKDEMGASLEIEVNGEHELSAYPMWECPEDATLERGFNFVYSIPRLMKQAYEAGKSGEEFVIENIEEGE
jgi:hypothetical protein